MSNENIPPCFYRISAKALILNEDRTKFLITQEDNGKWELPGGGLDWDEHPTDCITREIHEEMGLSVISVKESPSYFLTVKHLSGTAYVANVLYETVVEHLDFTPSSECVAIRFVDKKELGQLDAFPNTKAFGDIFKPGT